MAHFSHCPKYQCRKKCLAGHCLEGEKKRNSVLSDFQASNGCAASRAWEQTLLPDAVPVCSWMDIKVLAIRQARLFMGAEQPYHCCNGYPDLDLHWYLYISIEGICMSKSSHTTTNHMHLWWQNTKRGFKGKKLSKHELTRIFIVRVFPPQFFFSSIFCGDKKEKSKCQL